MPVQRIAPSFEPHEIRALELLGGEDRGAAKMAREIVRSFLATGLAELPPTWPLPITPTPANASGPPPAAVPAAPAGPLPPWIAPSGRAELEEWLDLRGPSVDALFARYPDELRFRHEDWPQDHLVSEAIFSMAIWREEIDAGRHPDPRVEITFRTTLRDLRPLLESRLRELIKRKDRTALIEALFQRYPIELQSRPEDWTSDQLVSEALSSLAVWREELDAGLHSDARAETVFRGALQDLSKLLENRQRAWNKLNARDVPDRTGPRDAS